MIRLLPLAVLVGLSLAAPAQAQEFGETQDQLRDDLRVVTNMIATAGLVRDATGAFPTTPFELLGSAAAGRTGLRQTPLSSLIVGRDGDRLTLDYVPLPVAPYERQDDIVRVVVTVQPDGVLVGDYQVVRRDDPDLGGLALPYDRAGRYVVERGYGTACVDLGIVRTQLAAGTYAAEPGSLSPAPLTVRVHPVGDDAPVLFETVADGVTTLKTETMEDAR